MNPENLPKGQVKELTEKIRKCCEQVKEANSNAHGWNVALFKRAVMLGTLFEKLAELKVGPWNVFLTREKIEISQASVYRYLKLAKKYGQLKDDEFREKLPLRDIYALSNAKDSKPPSGKKGPPPPPKHLVFFSKVLTNFEKILRDATPEVCRQTVQEIDAAVAKLTQIRTDLEERSRNRS